MDKNSYIDLKFALSSNKGNYSDEDAINIVKKLINYALQNFTDKEIIYEGYDYEYETEISAIALNLDAFLQKKPLYKKSKIIQKFIVDIIDNEIYKKGRSNFIYLLYILKMDDDLRRIATERKDFWYQSRIEFNLLYAIYRRNIRGFEAEAKILMDTYKKGDIHKYAKKYLEKMNK